MSAVDPCYYGMCRAHNLCVDGRTGNRRGHCVLGLMIKRGQIKSDGTPVKTIEDRIAALEAAAREAGWFKP